jgi:hypothetical protein
LEFSYYPVGSKANGLTGGKVQDNKKPSATEPAKAEEPTSSPDETSSTPEPAGMCIDFDNDMYINIVEGNIACAV